MDLFTRKIRKWIKKNQTAPWNLMFSDIPVGDVMITKLMVYECVRFSDALFSSHAFATQNIAARIDSILLAKMQFYHLVTKDPTVHNLFYGYIHELYTKHYKESLETTDTVISKMRAKEQLYLMWYYDFYENSTGDLKRVLSEYCVNINSNETSDGERLLRVSTDELRKIAAMELLNMQCSFMEKISH